MANVAIKMDGRAPLAAEDDYLGPAEVVSAAPSGVVVELPGGGVYRAELALAFPYEPAPGDLALVIARKEACYVIGILKGTGRAVFAIPGDVELRAVGGALRLTGDAGVEVTGPQIGLTANKLVMAADSMVQKLNTAYQRVRSLLQTHSGSEQHIVDETSFSRAKSAAIVTEETMSINGKAIHLG